MVQGVRFKVQDVGWELWFGVRGLGYRIYDLGFESEFRGSV
jgi:hypothetical protein